MKATAADVMRRDVITVRDTWDVREALRLFQQKGISGAPVLDDRGKLVGVLSVTDIARLQALHERPPSPEGDFYLWAFREEAPPGWPTAPAAAIPVREVMTPVVIDAPETMPVSRLAALMVDLHIHRVIITRDGSLVGIVSSTDLLKLLRDADACARRPPPEETSAPAEDASAPEPPAARVPGRA